jgi:hypothetical protein
MLAGATVREIGPMAARPKLNIPRREFTNGRVHYGDAFTTSGALCGARGQLKVQHRCRRPVDCARCIKIARWVWSHRQERGQGV